VGEVQAVSGTAVQVDRFAGQPGRRRGVPPAQVNAGEHGERLPFELWVAGDPGQVQRFLGGAGRVGATVGAQVRVGQSDQGGAGGLLVACRASEAQCPPIVRLGQPRVARVLADERQAGQRQRLGVRVAGAADETEGGPRAA
jgi:hypothetical protein